MRSSEVAAQAGVNVQTLRYYERRGLLPEPERLQSGYRSYGPESVRVIRFIKGAQSLGFTLKETDELLELAAGGPEGCDTARELATEKLTQLENKIANLSAMRDSLRQLVNTCERSRSRRVCPLVDALDEREDRHG